MEAKKLVDYDPSNENAMENFRCGNSMFSDNTWDFNGYIDNNHHSGARLKLKFEAFIDRPAVLVVIKKYVVDELLMKKFSTVKRNFDGLKRLVKFIDEFYPNLESLSEVNSKFLVEYFEYLLNAKNETTGKPLNRTGITKAALSTKEVLLRGAVKQWDSPQDVRFVHQLYNEMIISNKKLEKMKKTNLKKSKDKVIDEVVINETLQTALECLNKGEDVIPSAATIITSQVGLRLSELISLEEGCIQSIGGDKMLHYLTGKLNSETISVSKPINAIAEIAVNTLTKHTKELRNESGLSYLFLSRQRSVKGYPVQLISHANYNKNFLRPWLKKHKIKNKNGDSVEFTSHTFRHSFATYALRKGASIDVISELMNHKSIRGTQYYTHLIEEDVKKRFAEVLNEGAVISGKKALTIKDKLKRDNPFKGKTTDQVDSLRKAMKIQVLSHGLCLHHPMRKEPCEGDGVCLGCNNFVTTPEFLEVHKGRLKRVQDELMRAESNAPDGPFESKLRHIESYLVDIIADLESQLKAN